MPFIFELVLDHRLEHAESQQNPSSRGAKRRGDPGGEGMRRLLWIATSTCGLLAMMAPFLQT
jgi:hypothetical protein